MWLTLTNTWACDSVSLFCCKPVLNPLNTRKLSFVRMLLHSINQVNFQDFQGCTDENTQSQRHMWKSGGEKWILKRHWGHLHQDVTQLFSCGEEDRLCFGDESLLGRVRAVSWTLLIVLSGSGHGRSKNSLLFAFCLMHQTAYWTRYSRGFPWAVWM